MQSWICYVKYKLINSLINSISEISIIDVVNYCLRIYSKLNSYSVFSKGKKLAVAYRFLFIFTSSEGLG